MNDKSYFCAQCFIAQELIETIKNQGCLIPECKICHAKNVYALPTDNTQFKRIFRALIRVHYSEWSYNSHLGGDDFSTLLFGQNNIMNLSGSASKEEFRYAVDDIDYDWYPKNGEEISLGGGYWNGGILDGVNTGLDSRLLALVRRSFRENYFQIQKEVLKLLRLIHSDIDTILPPGSRFYRARIGVKKRLSDFDQGYKPGYLYLPYSGVEIGPPPIHLAAEGRMNRARVSILYLASDPETAVAEVRPHPGHLVSTAEFISGDSLKIADLTQRDIRNFLSDDRLDDLRLISSLNTLMNLPAPPDNHVMYLITQLFSDCIRESGFDGVRFKSSLGNGMNLACFKDAIFSLVPESGKVFEVSALEYQLRNAETPADDYHEEDYNEISDDPFSTLFEIIERKQK